MNFSWSDKCACDETGSTVIEIIVAFAIVSIALIQGFDLIASSARSGVTISEKATALAVAENQLALLRTAGGPEVAQTAGRTDDGFVYSVKISPVQPAQSPAGTATTQAFRITVKVARGQRDLISLQSWALFPFDRQ